MLRHCSCVIALAVMLVGLSTAQAADETLTLACQGTSADTAPEKSKPEPISMGVIINMANRTVQGFFLPGSDTENRVKLTDVNEVAMTFYGSFNERGRYWSISGALDRVTGDTDATINSSEGTTHYSLKCRPAQRMF